MTVTRDARSKAARRVSEAVARVAHNGSMAVTQVGPAVRRAGILLHPTSLPGPGPNGTFGREALAFLDLLHAAGQTAWQVLPLGPPDDGGSPYASRSAFAGGAHLLDLSDATEGGSSFEEFESAASAWLDDWALFEALRHRFGGAPWWEWPAELASRTADALAAARTSFAEAVEDERQRQWKWWQQWQHIRGYAGERGVEVIGDIPIFVDHNSADAWANQSLFKLDVHGRPRVVAGVPPDLFSETGQRWGNPLYDWEAMSEDGYGWWVERMRWSLRLFDAVRVDHFRGFAAAWEIPVASPTAQVGEWVPGPGKALFDAMADALGPLPLIAEDLGIITPDVTALRRAIKAPGMAVLQFAWGGDALNPYLPHNIAQDSVVYTGTHDNDTSAGWLGTLDPGARDHLTRYAGRDIGVREFVRMAYASVARTAIVPFQDVLGLGGQARMNTPGTTEGNWRWRFGWDQVAGDASSWLRDLVALYGRDGRSREDGR